MKIGGRSFCRQRRRSRGRENCGHLTMNQIGRQSGQLLAFIPGEAIFDRDVLTLGKTCVFQTLTDCGQEVRGVAGRPGGEEPDHWHRRLLRARRERPRDRRAAEQRDALAAFAAIIRSPRRR